MSEKKVDKPQSEDSMTALVSSIHFRGANRPNDYTDEDIASLNKLANESLRIGTLTAYDANEHRHRFAIWAAARATQRGAEGLALQLR